MNWPIAVVAIVAIVMLAEVLKAKYRARHGITTDNAGNEKHLDRPDPAVQHEVEELRERIKVLERITTDANSSHALESRRVSDEIEKLRDR